MPEQNRHFVKSVDQLNQNIDPRDVTLSSVAMEDGPFNADFSTTMANENNKMGVDLRQQMSRDSPMLSHKNKFVTKKDSFISHLDDSPPVQPIFRADKSTEKPEREVTSAKKFLAKEVSKFEDPDMEESEQPIEEPPIDAPRFSTVDTNRGNGGNDLRDFASSLMKDNLHYMMQLEREECIRDTVR